MSGTNRTAMLTGGRGTLGTALARVLSARDYRLAGDVPGGTRTELTDFPALQAAVDRERPDSIWHIAAATDVDRCEREPDWAFANNAMASEYVAAVAARMNIPVLYISTSAVFGGGGDGPHSEMDSPAPVNHYGRTKLYGERAVQAIAPRWFVLRAGWLIGDWRTDRKFVGKIVDQLRAGAEEIRAVEDKIGTPTFADEFAKQAIAIFESEAFGLYHVVNEGHATRLDMARLIVESMGLGERVRVRAVQSSEFLLSAPRPRSEMLDPMKLRLGGTYRMRPWQAALLEHVSNLRQAMVR